MVSSLPPRSAGEPHAGPGRGTTLAFMLPADGDTAGPARILAVKGPLSELGLHLPTCLSFRANRAFHLCARSL